MAVRPVAPKLAPMPRAAEKSDPCGLRPACRAPVARHLSQAKKGMWMGGNVPLGYDVKDRKLIINEPKAAMFLA